MGYWSRFDGRSFAATAVIASISVTALAQGSAEKPPSRDNAALTRGLVSAWRGDDGGADRGGGRNTGRVTGTPTSVPGMVGMGLRFSGPDDGVMVPDSPSLKLTGSMTLSCWTYIEAFPSVEQTASMLVFRGDDRNGQDPYHLEITSGRRVRFVIEAGAGIGADLSAPIESGRFVLVTATLDAETGRMRLYLNGELASETTTEFTAFGDLDPNANPGLGIGNHGGIPTTGFRFPFKGVLNEVLLYNRALAAGEIKSLFTERTQVASLSR